MPFGDIIDIDKTTTLYPHSKRTVKTVVDLKKEIKLSQRVLKIFKKAVDLHIDENFNEAIVLYQKLRNLTNPKGKKLDLYIVSKVFKHNWDMAEKHKLHL